MEELAPKLLEGSLSDMRFHRHSPKRITIVVVLIILILILIASLNAQSASLDALSF